METNIMYECINGWTKEKMIERISKEFKGKATDKYACYYLTDDGKKCAVGLFIPEGHEAQKTQGRIDIVLELLPDLYDFLPLTVEGLKELQSIHDYDLKSKDSLEHQTEQLVQWVNNHVG